MKTIELSISDKNKSLLTHLQENGEFLPAYCAGRGTCGKCKVQFLNNIPAYTTHDAAFFSAKELSEGWRLACQAYIKGQFTIQIEDYEEDQIQAASAFNLSADKSVSKAGPAAVEVTRSRSLLPITISPFVPRSTRSETSSF